MNMARSQFNYDHAEPYDSSKREAQAEAMAEQLTADMWQDLEHLSDALDDAVYRLGNYRRGNAVHEQCVTLLTLIRDGSDDADLGRMLRLAARDYINGKALDEAEERVFL